MPNREQADGVGTAPGVPPQPGCREAAPAPSGTGLAAFAWRAVVVLLLVGVAYLLWRGAHVLLLTFAGLLFAVFLSSLSGWLSRRTGLPSRWALAAVVVGLALAAGGLCWLLANQLAVQAAELGRKVPQSLQQARGYLEAYPGGRLLLERIPRVAESLAQTGAFWRVTGLVSGLAGFLVAGVVIFFVGIFGAAAPGVYKQGLLYLIPPRRRPRVDKTLDEVALQLRGWLVGQLALMVMIGATTAVGLWLLGIPLALTLGIIAGILELIPYVGAWLSAVPAAMVALLVGPWHLVMVLALFLGIHILEGYFLAPLVQSRAVHLPPALTLVTQVLLGELVGVLGVFVAAPLAVSVIVLLKRLYVEDALGDQSVEGEGPAGPARAAPALCRTGDPSRGS